MQNIYEKQLEDSEIIAYRAKYPQFFFNKTLNDQDIICYSSKDITTRHTLFKILLPINMVAQTIQ